MEKQMNERCVSVIIPVYNEVKTIEMVINSVLGMDCVKDLIVVDDRPSDGTWDILKNLKKSLPLHIERHKINIGKGAALRIGLKHCSDDIVIIQDADLEYDPNEYPKLIEPILQNKADVVYGSRIITGMPHCVLYFWHAVGNKFLTFFSNIFTNLTFTDIETGYKVFKKEVIETLNIEENRFGVEPEINAKIARQNWRIYEV